MGKGTDLIIGGLVIGIGVIVIRNITKGGTNTGSLSITVSPSEAAVTIGNQVVQPGIYSEQPGQYAWSASANGYVPQSGTISVNVGETTHLDIVLNPLEDTSKAILLVNLISPNSIQFDLNETALTSGTYQLDPGNYTWTASASGYVTQTGNLVLVAGQSASLPIELTPTGGGSGEGDLVASNPSVSIQQSVHSGPSYHPFLWVTCSIGYDIVASQDLPANWSGFSSNNVTNFSVSFSLNGKILSVANGSIYSTSDWGTTPVHVVCQGQTAWPMDGYEGLPPTPSGTKVDYVLSLTPSSVQPSKTIIGNEVTKSGSITVS